MEKDDMIGLNDFAEKEQDKKAEPKKENVDLSEKVINANTMITISKNTASFLVNDNKIDRFSMREINQGVELRAVEVELSLYDKEGNINKVEAFKFACPEQQIARYILKESTTEDKKEDMEDNNLNADGKPKFEDYCNATGDEKGLFGFDKKVVATTGIVLGVIALIVIVKKLSK